VATGKDAFPIEPPVEPMLSKLAAALPEGDGWLFEPKWDGFRAIVFRAGDAVYTQSRDCRPLDRYFPELAPLFRDGLGLDSIDILELALAISQTYSVQLRADNDDNEAIFRSLRSLNDHIQRHRPA